MSKEVTNQDILRAITEVANELKETKGQLNQKIDVTKVELNQKIDVTKAELNQKIDSIKAELQEAISNVENKVDLVDSHLYVQAGDLSRTKAEVKMLQDAKS